MLSTMIRLSFLAALLPAALAQVPPAPTAKGNPPGAQYIATLPNNANLPNGNLVVSSTSDGDGVNVQVSINSLPTSGGPFCELAPVRNILPGADLPSQCTTSTSIRSTIRATVPPPAPISILTMSLSSSHATQQSQKTARSAICPESTAR